MTKGKSEDVEKKWRKIQENMIAMADEVADRTKVKRNAERWWWRSEITEILRS